MNFAALPPEINSLRMCLGAGSAPMVAASIAWSGLAEDLASAAQSFSSVTDNLAGQAWQGPSAQAMALKASGYHSFLADVCGRALGASQQAKAVASAFEAAKSAMIHPQTIAANRAAFAQLIRSNILGLNAPAIMAAESVYEEFWATDVAAMFGYHGGASAAAAQLSSWQQALQSAPGVARLFGIPSAAPSDPNLGIGNKGGGNIGNGNNSGTGAGNLGNGNTGSGNVGGGNKGSSNFGSGNTGDGNIGFGNIGTGNIGIGNSGPNLLTAGNNNVGLGNSGNNNFGLGNHGTGNQGGGNTGNNNLGFGLQGNNLVGLGNAYFDRTTGQFYLAGLNSGTGNIGFGNSGTGNIGFFNSGDGNVGIFNSGTNDQLAKFGHIQGFGFGNSGSHNLGFGNAGSANFGFGNAGASNTGIGNTGIFDTGFGNSGTLNTGMQNSGNYNTFNGNSGNVNTGFWNSGSFNTGFGADTDVGGTTKSGYNNTGSYVSGFNNTGTDPQGGEISGFFNTASGGSQQNGVISGWFNTGVTGPLPTAPSGFFSGFGSGVLNTGSGFVGLFNIISLLKTLGG